MTNIYIVKDVEIIDETVNLNHLHCFLNEKDALNYIKNLIDSYENNKNLTVNTKVADHMFISTILNKDNNSKIILSADLANLSIKETQKEVFVYREIDVLKSGEIKDLVSVSTDENEMKQKMISKVKKKADYSILDINGDSIETSTNIKLDNNQGDICYLQYFKTILA